MRRPGRRRLLPDDVPREVLSLQLGGLLNAFGNGVVLPFLVIYFHTVRGISLGVSGLVVATGGIVALAAGPLSGPLVDRLGGKRVLGGSLAVLSLGFVVAVFAHGAPTGFAAMALVGLGNAAFWAAQSTLIAGHTTPGQRPAAFALQRVAMNLGVGLGALAGGLIADADRPSTFTVLLVLDAATFLVYLAVLVALVPDVDLGGRSAASRTGYGTVVRNRPFVGVIVLNALLIFGGISGFELFPVAARRDSGVSELGIGLVFFVNTVVIVLTQLAIARRAAGYRRMRLLGLVGLVWGTCWIAVAVVGSALDGAAAAIALCLVMAVFALGECVHGAVYGPLMTDLAEPEAMGRYMALSAVSWQVGFSAGPAAGGFLLAQSSWALWTTWAGLCLAAVAFALALERSLPETVRRSPRHAVQA